MHLETMRFTPTDLAKYPFLKETAAYMKKLGLEINELTSPELGQILLRAKDRLEKSLLFIYTGERCDNDVEIPSFPVAIMLALATKNSFVKKRFALSEAKQAYADFQVEPKDRLMAIARDFDWDIKMNTESKVPIDYFSIRLADYLRNISHLRDSKWKLANRLLSKGRIFLSQQDVARLLQEEVQRRIEARLNAKDILQFPKPIEDIASKMLELAKEKIGESEMEGFPKEVSQSSFPPCIDALYAAAAHGKHLGHVERFTLVSFLVTIGMPTEKVAEVFKTFSDYNMRLTLYQVEHIAGSKGSGTKYTPPSCSTLQTHGVCANSDELCRRIHHPLNYYLRKQRTAYSPVKAEK